LNHSDRPAFGLSYFAFCCAIFTGAQIQKDGDHGVNRGVATTGKIRFIEIECLV
jgi:hypothetical protein